MIIESKYSEKYSKGSLKILKNIKNKSKVLVRGLNKLSRSSIVYNNQSNTFMDISINNIDQGFVLLVLYNTFLYKEETRKNPRYYQNIEGKWEVKKTPNPDTVCLYDTLGVDYPKFEDIESICKELGTINKKDQEMANSLVALYKRLLKEYKLELEKL